jgi:hypothetical protein
MITVTDLMRTQIKYFNAVYHNLYCDFTKVMACLMSFAKTPGSHFSFSILDSAVHPVLQSAHSMPA